MACPVAPAMIPISKGVFQRKTQTAIGFGNRLAIDSRRQSAVTWRKFGHDALIQASLNLLLFLPS
jgi:hypothetical protein